MNRDEFPAGVDEARRQRSFAHDDEQIGAVAPDEDEGAIEFRVSSPSPAELMATWKHLSHAHIGGPVQPKFVIEEVTDPAVVARFQAQDERARRNEAWLQSHWSDLLPRARGRFIAVAGQEAFIADSQEEAWERATAAHPDDDGIVEQYIRAERGPRLYAHQG
jgi:hypothetical protein